jgi:hypothetical protein
MSVDSLARLESAPGGLHTWQTGKNRMTDKTAIQRIQELDRERAALFEQAKEEALQRANQAVDDLNALGLNYRLVAPPAEKAPAGSKSPAKKPQETGVADKKRPARPPG